MRETLLAPSGRGESTFRSVTIHSSANISVVWDPGGQSGCLSVWVQAFFLGDPVNTKVLWLHCSL